MRKIIIAMGATTLLGCTIDNGSTEPGTPVTITWAPCINDINAPSWMAVKDGDGAWTRIVQANGVYTFTVRSGRVGIATHSNSELQIDYITTDEANASKLNCAGVLRDVTGTITGFSTLDDVDIFGGHAEATVAGTAAQPASFTISNVTPAAFDLLAVKSRHTVAGSVTTDVPSSVFIRRAVNTTQLAAMDFASAESGPPQSKTLTIVNAAANENIVAVASYNTPSAAIDMSTYSTTLATATGTVTASFSGLPAARVATGEAQTLDLFSSINVNSTTTMARTATLTFTDIADKTLTLGPALGPVSIGTGTRPSAVYAIQQGYDQTFEVNYSQGTGVAAHSIDIAMSRGYLGAAATSVTLDIPDLSGLNGFQTSWLLSPGATAKYDFFAAGASYGIFSVNNQTYTAASKASTFIP